MHVVRSAKHPRGCAKTFREALANTQLFQRHPALCASAAYIQHRQYHTAEEGTLITQILRPVRQNGILRQALLRRGKRMHELEHLGLLLNTPAGQPTHNRNQRRDQGQ